MLEVCQLATGVCSCCWATAYLSYEGFFVDEWSADWFQAGGSLLAVSVALFYPLLERRKKTKNIRKVIERELVVNMKIIKRICVEVDRQLPGGPFVTKAQLQEAQAKHLKIKYWEMYGYELSVNDLKAFDAFRDVYSHLEEVVRLVDSSEVGKSFFLEHAAKECLAAYQERFSS